MDLLILVDFYLFYVLQNFSHYMKLSIFFYRKCEWINFILKYTIFVIHWYILKKIGQLLWEQCQINIFLKTIG